MNNNLGTLIRLGAAFGLVAIVKSLEKERDEAHKQLKEQAILVKFYEIRDVINKAKIRSLKAEIEELKESNSKEDQDE